MTAAANNGLVVNTFQHRPDPSRAIIGLHGITGDETALKPLVYSVNLKTAKWFFPRAPYPAEKGFGYSWFGGDDEKGWRYEATWAGLHHLIEATQKEGFPRDRIFLLGFSQGACLVMEFGLRLNFPLGGLIPIAGFIKNPEKLRNDMTAESTKTPVLLLHGTEDRIVTPDGSKTAYEFLVRQGNPVRLEWYSSGHKIPVKAGALIKKFIQG